MLRAQALSGSILSSVSPKPHKHLFHPHSQSGLKSKSPQKVCDEDCVVIKSMPINHTAPSSPDLLGGQSTIRFPWRKVIIY